MDLSSFLTGFGVGAFIAILAVFIEFYVRVSEPRSRRRREALRVLERALIHLHQHLRDISEEGDLFPAMPQENTNQLKRLRALSNELDLPRTNRRWFRDTIDLCETWESWKNETKELIVARTDHTLKRNPRFEEMLEPFRVSNISWDLVPVLGRLALKGMITAEAVRTHLLIRYDRDSVSEASEPSLQVVFMSKAFYRVIEELKKVESSATLSQFHVETRHLLARIDAWTKKYAP